MPIATPSDLPTRKDLKTLPGAFIEIRRMDHGQRMARQQLINKAKFGATRGSKRVDIEMDIINADVTLFEWKHCIVSHNLEYLKDPNDKDSVAPLDFTNPAHVRMVDGRVSDEISTYLDEINNFDPDMDDDKEGNS